MTDLLLSNGRIFDGISPKLKTGLNILVSDGRIKNVFDAGNGPDTRHATAIDLGGKVLMPGLIDAHVHATCAGLDVPGLTHRPPTYLASFANMFLKNSLYRGFCTVRDAAGADFGLAQAIRDGFIEGSRLFFSGKALGQTGGHGDFRTTPEHDVCSCNFNGQLALIVDGEDEVRKAAREELRKGATQIKIFVSGGVVSPSDPVWMDQMTDVEIRAAVEEAATRRTYVMAHAHTASAIERAVKLGVRSIEHGTMINDQAAEAVCEAGAFVVPTLALVYALNEFGEDFGLPPVSQEKLKKIFDNSMNAMEVCKKYEIPVGFGTDLIGILEKYQCNEFAIRSEIMSPFEILQSATSINAKLLQMEGELGVISEGALADIIVVERDPLEDLSVFGNEGEGISLILKEGQIVKNLLTVSRTP